jgi:hydroxyacyl-ACP dehydratase HTD2-like protein with hotdog domain
MYDGSECKKAVKQFSFRLLRYASANEKLDGKSAKCLLKQEVYDIKMPGCKSGQKID